MCKPCLGAKHAMGNKSVTVELLIRSFMHIKCSEKENANMREQCFYWLI